MKNNNYFKAQGEHCYLQPWNYGTEPHMISFGNNVHVASGVTFINHDVAHKVLNNLGSGNYDYNSGCIEVMNNVFIGSNTIILPNIKIGSNVIVAAGSVVTKDIPDDSVVAGVPARVIGKFSDYVEKRKKHQNLSNDMLWAKFNDEKNR